MQERLLCKDRNNWSPFRTPEKLQRLFIYSSLNLFLQISSAFCSVLFLKMYSHASYHKLTRFSTGTARDTVNEIYANKQATNAYANSFLMTVTKDALFRRPILGYQGWPPSASWRTKLLEAIYQTNVTFYKKPGRDSSHPLKSAQFHFRG